MFKHINIGIFGQVQGVGFRYFAKEKANQLGVRGFVQNMPDGSVYLEVEGQSEDLEMFIEWCNNGPSFAKVNNIEITEGKIINFRGFEIKK